MIRATARSPPRQGRSESRVRIGTQDGARARRGHIQQQGTRSALLRWSPAQSRRAQRPAPPRPIDRPARRPQPNIACRRKPASPLRRSVNVVVYLAGEVLWKVPQLFLRNHAAQPPGDPRNTRHFSRGRRTLGARWCRPLNLWDRLCHINLSLSQTRAAPPAGRSVTLISKPCPTISSTIATTA